MSIPDFSDVFAAYQTLLAEADAVFAKVKAACPREVVCEPACSDCCHAPFDVSLVEALFLNRAFNERFPKGDERHRLTTAANAADREHYRLKHKAWKAHKAGMPDEALVAEFGKERIRCPLLGADERCEMYDVRPLTCRLYGAPLDVGGQLKVCGKTGFAPGGRYPAVKIARLQAALAELSALIAQRVDGRYDYLGDMLVPVSMALLTSYDEEFFGLTEPKGDDQP